MKHAEKPFAIKQEPARSEEWWPVVSTSEEAAGQQLEPRETYNEPSEAEPKVADATKIGMCVDHVTLDDPDRDAATALLATTAPATAMRLVCLLGRRDEIVGDVVPKSRFANVHPAKARMSIEMVDANTRLSSMVREVNRVRE